MMVQNSQESLCKYSLVPLTHSRARGKLDDCMLGNQAVLNHSVLAGPLKFNDRNEFPFLSVFSLTVNTSLRISAEKVIEARVKKSVDLRCTSGKRLTSPISVLVFCVVDGGPRITRDRAKWKLQGESIFFHLHAREV